MAKKEAPPAKPAKKATGKTLAKWDEKLAAMSKQASDMEQSNADRKFFSLKSGQLSFDDARIPGNQIAVVILDGVLENVWYDGDYDPDVPQSPSCFAFGRSEDEMEPHKDAVNRQASLCSECPLNKFGSAEKGRGKACRNGRRLALLAAGTVVKGELELFTDPEYFRSQPVAYMKIPPTSIRAYGAFVKSIANGLKLPPCGVFAKISVEPDDKSQFRVEFEAIEEVPADIMEAILERYDEVVETIDFPYQQIEEDEKPKASARGGKAAGGKAKPGKRASRF